MVDLLIRWSLAHRAAVLLLALCLALGGTWLASRMPVDVLPDLTAPTVTVMVEAHDLSAEAMERQVVVPLEAAVNGAPGVRRVRSAATVGLAVVWVEFDWDIDVNQARLSVAERLPAVADKLPAQAQVPKLAPVSSIMGEILFLALVSDTHDELALRTTADTQVRRRLLAVPGVSQVTILGGQVKQYRIDLDPLRLQQFGLDAEAVAEAVLASNEIAAGGVLVRGPQEVVVEGHGAAQSVEDLAQSVVARVGLRSILVSDLGTVSIGGAPRRGIATATGRAADGSAPSRPAVVVAVQRQPNANTLTLTRELDITLDALQQSIPAGMQLERRAFRQASFIETALENTLIALIEGALMVVLVVLVFLASVRASLVTLVVLPLSLITALVVLQLVGDGINTMTLGGLAIAIGALVDDAIIDVENTVRRLRERALLPIDHRPSLLTTVYQASIEVRPSIVMATLIIVLVFTPIFFLDGVEGRLLQPLGLAFSIALGASLLVALTLTPALCAMTLPTARTVRSTHEPRVVSALKRWYARPLDVCLRFPKSISIAGAALLAVAVMGFTRLGTGFLPEFQEGALVISVVTEPGTSLDASNQLTNLVDRSLANHPEIVAAVRRTGRAEDDEHIQGSEASEIDLTLDMDAPRQRGLATRTREELLAALREDLARIPGIQVTIGQPIGHRIDHMLSGSRSSIAIKVQGNDFAQLRSTAKAIEAAITHIPGVVDLNVEQQALVPSLRVDLDRDALALHGVQVHTAANALRAATTGLDAGEVIEGPDRRRIVVRTGTANTTLQEDKLRDAWVRNEAGALVPLGALVQMVEDRTPNYIAREDLERKLVVSCNVAERDLGSVVHDIQTTVANSVSLPAGVRVEYGGQFASAQATTERLYALGVVIIVAIAGLLRQLFGSWRDALLVMINLPLALVGGVAGVYLAGGVLSVAALIGFITVFGVAARNGIMVVSHIHHLQAVEGLTNFAEVVRRAALERLAPVVMTALAAGLALVPLALRGDEPGNEILAPMAMVILCGLATATILNMLVVPSLYLRFGRPLAKKED